jgi:hypothetical protein
MQRVAFIIAHLIRAIMWATSRESLGEHRYGRRHAELTNNLAGWVAQAETPYSFFAELCTRFEVDPSDVDRGGRRGPIEIHLDGDWVRWDRALVGIPLEAIRLVVTDCPPFLGTFAIHPLYLERSEGQERARIDHAEEAKLFEREWPLMERGGWACTPSTAAIFAGRWMALVHTIEPLHHGSEQKGGNTAMFRTEPVCDPLAGCIHRNVPLIAGGSWRGQARDLWMAEELRLRGLTKVDLPNWRLHELFSGGTLEKGADAAGVDLGLREKLRRLSPMWDLFGGVSGQQIMEGRLHIGDMIVVCRENAWRCHDLVKPTDKSGKPIPLDDWASKLMRADQLLSGSRYGTRKAHKEIADSEGVQMIFRDQTLVVGTPMIHTLGLYCIDAVTELHRAALAHGLKVFRDRQAKVGAKGSRGMGGITFGDYQPVHGQVDLGDDTAYLEHLKATQEEAIAFLRGEGEAASTPARGRRQRKPAAAVG